MRNNIKYFIYLLVMILVLGIGYAAISSINLNINGTGGVSVNQNNFKVKFLSESPNEPTINPDTGNIVTVENDTTATFNITSLNKKDDTVVVTLMIKNESNDIGADIYLDVENSNSNYFDITSSIAKKELQAGETTTATVTVKVKKTPTTTTQSSIKTTLIAYPIEDDEAVSTDERTNLTPFYAYTKTTHDNMILGGKVVFQELTNNISRLTLNDVDSFMKVRVNNSIIDELYLGYILNNEIYYLRAGESEWGTDRHYFNSNVETLYSTFGEENCELSSVECICQLNGVCAKTYEDGSADFIVNKDGKSWGCSVNDVGIFHCFNY